MRRTERRTRQPILTIIDYHKNSSDYFETKVYGFHDRDGDLVIDADGHIKTESVTRKTKPPRPLTVPAFKNALHHNVASAFEGIKTFSTLVLASALVVPFIPSMKKGDLKKVLHHFWTVDAAPSNADTTFPVAPTSYNAGLWATPFAVVAASIVAVAMHINRQPERPIHLPTPSIITPITK